MLKKQAGRKGGIKAMNTTDPIADMLTRIRNANAQRHATVDVPYSKEKEAIANILVAEGFVETADIIEDNHKTIRITLKYKDNVKYSLFHRYSLFFLSIYNNKKSTGDESAQQIESLRQSLDAIGYKINFSRGDYNGK